MSSEAVLLSVSNCILDSQNPTLQFVTASPVASTTLGTFISLANSATETPGSTDEAATCECIHNDACSVPISEKIIRPDNHFQRRLQKMRTTSLSTTGRYLAALSRGGGSFLSPDMESLEANRIHICGMYFFQRESLTIQSFCSCYGGAYAKVDRGLCTI